MMNVLHVQNACCTSTIMDVSIMCFFLNDQTVFTCTLGKRTLARFTFILSTLDTFARYIGVDALEMLK